MAESRPHREERQAEAASAFAAGFLAEADFADVDAFAVTAEVLLASFFRFL